MDIQTEIQRISEKTGIDLSEVKAELEKLKVEGYKEPAALAIYKSTPVVKNRLSGQIYDNAVLVPYKVSDVREVQTAKGPSTVANVEVLFMAEGQWRAGSLSLWNEAAEKAKEFQKGQAVSAKIKTNDNNEKIALLEGPIPTTTPVPPMTELISQVGVLPLNELYKAEGQECFVRGIVGHSFDTEKAMGIELSDVGSDVVTIFISKDTPIRIGEEVTLLARVSKRDDSSVFVWGELLK